MPSDPVETDQEPEITASSRIESEQDLPSDPGKTDQEPEVTTSHLAEFPQQVGPTLERQPQLSL